MADLPVLCVVAPTSEALVDDDVAQSHRRLPIDTKVIT